MPRMWNDFLLQTWPLLYVAATGIVIALLQMRRHRRVATMLLTAMLLYLAHVVYLPLLYAYHRTFAPGLAVIPLRAVHQLVSDLLFVTGMLLVIGAVFAGRRDPRGGGFHVRRL